MAKLRTEFAEQKAAWPAFSRTRGCALGLRRLERPDMVAGEIRNPQRNIPLALIWGVRQWALLHY